MAATETTDRRPFPQKNLSKSAKRRARAARSAERWGWNTGVAATIAVVIFVWLMTSFVMPAFQRPTAPPAPSISILDVSRLSGVDKADGTVKLPYRITFAVSNNLKLDAAKNEHLVVSTTFAGTTVEYPVPVGQSYYDMSYPPQAVDSQAAVRINVVDVNGTTRPLPDNTQVFVVPAAQAAP